MLRFSKLLLGAATGAMIALSAGTANADLIIAVNGSTVASTPTNVFTNFVGSADSGHWNVVSVGLSGIGALLPPHVADIGTLSVSTDGLGADLNLTATETNLTDGAPGGLQFLANFTNALPSNLSFTRSFYLDPTNAGLETDLLASVTGTSALNTFISSGIYPVTGTYSITEHMTFHVVNSGTPATISADDDLHVVPEPPTLVLLGTALLGLGFLRFRKKNAAWTSI